MRQTSRDGVMSNLHIQFFRPIDLRLFRHWMCFDVEVQVLSLQPAHWIQPLFRSLDEESKIHQKFWDY